MTNNEEQKSTIDKLLAPLGLTTIKLSEEVKLEQMKLDDGTTLIEADSFEAGQPVMIVTEDDQMIPLPVGEYGLEDGRMLVVNEEGVIAEIKDAQTEEEAEPMEEAPVAQSEAPTAAPVAKKVVESVSKESYFSADMQIPDVLLEAIAKVVDERMNANKVEEVTEEVELSNVKPIVHNPERVSLASKLNQEGGLTSFLNNIK